MKPEMTPLVLLASFVLSIAPCASRGSEAAVPARSNADSGELTGSPWERIVLIGASASAGFTASEPLGGPTTAQYQLSRYVSAAIAVRHGPVRSLASKFFFMQPSEEAQREVELALKSHPTLVLGADFLFWFCYGDGRTDQERLQRFEQGLKLCEEFHCPLVLGDIPDASIAVNGMLSPDEIPRPSAISAANRRLRAWAGLRSNVVVLSLSNFMATVVANRPLLIHGRSLPEGRTRILLQSDNLHPSAPGCAVLSLLMLDAYESTRAGSTADEVIWDPKQVFRTAYSAAHPATAGATNATPTGPSPPKEKKAPRTDRG